MTGPLQAMGQALRLSPLHPSKLTSKGTFVLLGMV